MDTIDLQKRFLQDVAKFADEITKQKGWPEPNIQEASMDVITGIMFGSMMEAQAHAQTKCDPVDGVPESVMLNFLIAIAAMATSLAVNSDLAKYYYWRDGHQN